MGSAPEPQGFDLGGAARDLDERARRHAPIYARPHMPECMRLLHRNPDLAPAVRSFIEAEMAKLPGGGVGLDAPLWTPDGKLAIELREVAG